MNEKVIAAILAGIKKHDEVVVKKVSGRIVVVAVDRKVLIRADMEG